MWRRSWLALLSSALFVSATFAQPQPRLTVLTPPGGQAGTSVKITLAGADLDDTTSLLIAPAGLTAERVPDPAKKGQFLANQFEIKIPADTQPGTFDIRAVGAWGVSNPRAFVVGELAEVLEKEPNNDVPLAQPLSLNHTVNGVVQAVNDVDYFAVACKKDQHVIVQVAAESLDSRLDPDLKVYDAAGRLIAANRPRAEPDAVCAFTVATDGTYFIRLCAHAHVEGSAECFYRLSASTRPWIDLLYPPVVEPGKASHVTLWGRNLPGGQVEAAFKVNGQPVQRMEVTLAPPGDPQAEYRITGAVWLPPARAQLDGFFYRIKNASGWSNPVPITFAQGPIVLEAAAHPTPDKAQPVPLPCELIGRIEQRANQDWYVFSGNAGDVVELEGFAERIGSPVDLYFELQRADNGSLVGEYDDHPEQSGYHRFFARTDDPAARVTLPVKGQYRLKVSSRDASLRGDPRLVYRVSLRKPKPDFRAVLVDAQPATPTAPCLRPGGRQHFDVILFRKGGFTGPVTLSVDGLPAGVTSPPQQVAAGVNFGTLVFSAADKVADFSGVVTVKATATIEGQTVTRDVRAGCLIWPNPNEMTQGPGISRLCRSMALAVRQSPAPIRVTFTTPKPNLPAGGTTNVKLKVERLSPDAKVPVTVTALHLPPGVAFNNNQPLVVPADKTEVEAALRVAATVPAESFPLVVRGSAPVPFNKDPKAKTKAAVTMYETSLPIIVEAYKRVADVSLEPASITVKQGSEASVLVKVKRLNGYKGQLQVQLQGLPNGVTAPGGTIYEKVNELKLTFKAAKNAAIANGTVTIRVTGNVPPAALTTEIKSQITVQKGE
jgi:hypothetical protein